jgi:ABC-type phosphate/phosphonate transport system ATPase subunit
MEGTLNDASSSAIEVPQSRQQRPMLEIAGLRKRFGAVEVLRDVSLAVNPGEVVVVIGPSGSGKTTLLRCINLLEEYESGTITIDGEPIGYRVDARAGRRLRMSERDVAAARPPSDCLRRSSVKSNPEDGSFCRWARTRRNGSRWSTKGANGQTSVRKLIRVRFSRLETVV